MVDISLATSDKELQGSPSVRTRIRVWALKPLSGSSGPIFIALVLVCVALSVLTSDFLTPGNIANVITQSSVVGIAAVGATFVIITAGIDLSVGATVALSGMLGALVGQNGGNAYLALGVSMLTAAALGAFNGVSVAKFKLSPFIVTLAVLGMARGLTLQLSQGGSIYNLPDQFVFLGSGSVGGLQAPAVVTFFVFLLGHLVLTRTTFGHQIFAVGGNREAARLSGIKVSWVLFVVYVFAGLCAGLAAIVLTGRLAAATPTAANGLELQVIAAVVIGGTSLFGGKGSLLGTLIGVLLIGVINNGLVLLNVSPYLVQFVQGAIIFAAVAVDAVGTRRQDSKT
jgi:ribose transport system permease protein